MSVDTAAPLIRQLKSMLIDLHLDPYPHVSNPPKCKKRASVALIVRIRPSYPDVAEFDAARLDECVSVQEKFETFFSQAWVQRGDPEVLFIKRAARKGDRWTGHVAFPGGKRDPGDESDRATSIRETMEEIGLDLKAPYCHFVGNLAQRVVTTSWGTVPLMVLCPFVFLVTKYDLPPLRLQPTEINSAYWVSFRALLVPSLRTYERCDISDRLSRPGGWLFKGFLRILLGQLLFSAIRLVPSESLYASSYPGFIPDREESLMSALKTKLDGALFDHAASSTPNRPLLLWGLTHGMMADFLDLLPNHGHAKLWTWPSFSSWDIRFTVWLTTYRFRKRKLQELLSGSQDAPTSIGEGLGTLGVHNNRANHRSDEMLANADMPKHTESDRDTSTPRRPPSGISSHMLEGYWALIRKAIVIGLLLRCGLCAALIRLWFRGTLRNGQSKL